MKNNSNNIKLGSSPQPSQKKIDAAKRNFEQGGSRISLTGWIDPIVAFSFTATRVEDDRFATPLQLTRSMSLAPTKSL